MPVCDFSPVRPVDVYRPAAIANCWSEFDGPFAIGHANQFFSIAITKTESLDTRNDTQLPIVVADPANTVTTVAYQEPAIRQR